MNSKLSINSFKLKAVYFGSFMLQSIPEGNPCGGLLSGENPAAISLAGRA